MVGAVEGCSTVVHNRVIVGRERGVRTDCVRILERFVPYNSLFHIRSAVLAI